MEDYTTPQLNIDAAGFHEMLCGATRWRAFTFFVQRSHCYAGNVIHAQARAIVKCAGACSVSARGAALYAQAGVPRRASFIVQREMLRYKIAGMPTC